MNAQLVGCGTISCPTAGDSPQPLCVIGNATNEQIGVASVNTSVSSDPLTWTVGTAATTDPTNTSATLWTKSFYLGTPPSLDLNGSLPYTGCALFFEGVSTNLQFNNTRAAVTKGSCSDAMSGPCVDDLLSLATTQIASLVKNPSNDSTVCAQLQSALQDSVPGSCNAVHDGNWGQITSKEFTGTNAPPEIAQSACHPTTGVDYNIALVENFQLATENRDTLVIPFTEGITPVMTVFYPAPGTGSGYAPEAHLSCMKAIEEEGQGGLNQKSGASSLTRSAATLFVAMLLATFWC